MRKGEMADQDFVRSAHLPATGRASLASALCWRWARFSVRRRSLILVAAALVTASALPLALRLPVHGDLSDLLPPETTSVRDLRAIEKRAQVFGTVVVSIASDEPAQRQAAAMLVRDGFGRLPSGLLAGVAFDTQVRDRFVWNHRYMLALTDELTEVRDWLRAQKARLNPLYVALDDESAPQYGHGERSQFGERGRELMRRFDVASARAQSPAPIVSSDGRLQVIVVRTRAAAEAVSRNRAALEAIQRVVSEARLRAGPGVRIGMSGDVVNAAAEHRALLGGLLRATLFTVALVLAGLGLYFGAIAPLPVLLGPLILGAAVTFGFAFLVIGHLNLATGFLAPIIVGNGINFGIILLARYFEEREPGGNTADALARALTGSAGGTLTAALTAAVSYASLLTTDFQGFRHFGVIGGVGILCCWAATFLVLPAAVAGLEARGGLPGGPRTSAWGGPLIGISQRRPRLTAGVALVIFAVSAFGGARYLLGRPFEDDLKNLRSDACETIEIGAWTEKVEGAFGRSLAGSVVIAAPTSERAREVAQRLRSADRDRPEHDQLFAQVAVFDDLVPADQSVKLGLLASIRALLRGPLLATLPEEDRRAVMALDPPERLIPITPADVPADLAWPFTEQDGSRGRLVIAKVGSGFDMWRTEDLQRFVSTFHALHLGSDLIVGGNAFVQRDVIGSLERDGPRATIAALLGALLVVLAMLGMTRQALVTALCGLTGVLMLLAAAGMIGLRINFLDFVALPITVGIGVDYAVNLAARHRAEGPGSAARILATTGPAVALCSFTTVVGYASLLLSENRGVRSFGLASLIGELTCVLAALMVAPALLDLGNRVNPPSRGRTTDPQESE